MPDKTQTNQGIGERVPRVEDQAFLTGQGRFIDDINLPKQAYAKFVRSPHAHACIKRVDVTACSDAAGVISVLTAKDMADDGVGEIVVPSPLKNRDGSPIFFPTRRALALDKVVYLGEAVAVVIAESAALAEAAIDLVDIDYDVIDSVTQIDAALGPDAPIIHAYHGNNISLDWHSGDRAKTDLAFKQASHIIAIKQVNNRIISAALEPRGVVASFDAETQRYKVITPTQGLQMVLGPLANGLGTPTANVRLITPDVGGGFGTKNSVYPEQIVIPWASKKIGRPIKWTSGRNEAFLTDYHARDHLVSAELALDNNGKILAIRSSVKSSMGAYQTGTSALIPTNGGIRSLTNVYHVPTYYSEALCVFTNNTPTHAFRGAGKPEYCYLIERLMEKAAREIGLNSVEFRRRNLIPAKDMPYTTATGMIYDSGDYEGCMNRALELCGAKDVNTRKDKARASGKLYGLGLALYTEPDGFLDNRVTMRFDAEGTLHMTMTGVSNGQGHATVFRQIVASQLGLDFSKIKILQGDSDLVGPGAGTGGSRTTTVAGGATVRASEQMIEKGKQLAARLLEVDIEDLEFSEGLFTARGTNKSMDLSDVAKASFNESGTQQTDERGLFVKAHYKAETYNFPSGCHIAEVEIQKDTGETRVLRYTMVDDIGTVINPMLAEGQLHGGVAMGLGQALMEEARYDPETGQLFSGSFMDYSVPRAADTPVFTSEFNGTYCSTNPLGVKGAGEAGTTASMPAIVNAVVDALEAYDVTDIDMPLYAEKIWRIINR